MPEFGILDAYSFQISQAQRLPNKAVDCMGKQTALASDAQTPMEEEQ
jgi:hypothetical protein